MTPCECQELVDLHNRRERLQDERAAWMVHYIMAAFIGSDKAPSPDELLGRVTKL